MDNTPYLYETRLVYHNLNETLGPKAIRQILTSTAWTEIGSIEPHATGIHDVCVEAGATTYRSEPALPRDYLFLKKARMIGVHLS